MKRIVVFFSVFLFTITLAHISHSKSNRTISKHNEYGGTTEEETYSKGDDAYEEGILRVVEHYNEHHLIAKIESYYSDAKNKKDGVYKREQYYENEPMKGTKIKKAEFYYTTSFADQNGFNKVDQYFDSEGKKKREELYYTEEYSKKKLLSKIEKFYNSKGEVVKELYYDKNGKIIASEKEKK